MSSCLLNGRFQADGGYACSSNCRILAFPVQEERKALSVIHNLHTSRHRTGVYDPRSRPHPIEAIPLVFRDCENISPPFSFPASTPPWKSHVQFSRLGILSLRYRTLSNDAMHKFCTYSIAATASATRHFRRARTSAVEKHHLDT